MIGYITIGTNKFDAAVQFFDELFAEISIDQLWNFGTMAAWGQSPTDITFCVTKPHDGKVATIGNGTMIALQMESRAKVDAMHAKALELGGTDEGSPGPRGEHGFYGGYFRDLDGNKFNAYIPG